MEICFHYKWHVKSYLFFCSNPNVSWKWWKATHNWSLNTWVHNWWVIPGSSKKQPSTGNHRVTLLTPATPNFNVVIGSAEHHQQKWLFFLKAAKDTIQKTTLNWGTGGAWPLRCGTSWDGCFFWRTRWGFFWFRVHFNCCWYACGCRSAHIHTHTHRCDNISFWNLRIVKACASVICDSPIKVDAKG